MFDQARYEAEFRLLKRKLPDDIWRFCDLNGSRPYLAMAVKTRFDSLYTIQIELERFPNAVPKVFVTKMLKDRAGNNLERGLSAMHTLPSEHGWTRICHYGPESWTPMVSLYLIYIKAALWLNAYELHLRSGKPMEYYLNHQK